MIRATMPASIGLTPKASEAMASDTANFGPHVFREDAISEETHAFNAQIEETMRDMPPFASVPPQVTRDARESGESVFGPLQLSAMAVERTVPGRAGEVPVRVFVPDTVGGVYMHIHGGGWTIGRAHHQDPRMEQLARDCAVAVVSVDYRLAPEHPYPAGPDDCEDVAAWLVEHSAREFGSDRIVIGGGSAGGHLSAVTALRLRDRHGYTGLAGLNLIYGCYDLTMTPSAKSWGERRLVMTTSDIHWFLDQFVPEDMRADPDVSPLYADLRDMPRALFTVGTLDSILDDSLFMYARWVAAGNEAELAVYPGGAHGFDNFPIALAREANARMDAFIQRCLRG
jgi:acetyl esterase/lipase